MQGETRLPRESEFAAGLDDFLESHGPNMPYRLLKGLRAGVEEGMGRRRIMERPDVVSGMVEAGTEHTEEQLGVRVEYVLSVIRADVKRLKGMESWLEKLAGLVAGGRGKAAKRALAQKRYNDAKKASKQRREKRDE